MIHPNSWGLPLPPLQVAGCASSRNLSHVFPFAHAFLDPFSPRDTSYPLTALQGELAEGHWCPRARESRQVEHPSPAYRLPFLQLSCRQRAGKADDWPNVTLLCLALGLKEFCLLL